MTCSRCGCQKPENGGYRVRKHRDVAGTREVKVMKVRWSRCRKHLRCICPPGVSRYKWYSQRVEGIFAILGLHQVNEGCADEIAAHLGYPLKPETRSAWQATSAWRLDQLEQEQPSGKFSVASLDEFKVGHWWVYTLTDGASQAVVEYAVSESRSEEVVRDLIADQHVETFITDGCPRIEAACAWFANLPHGRCWFHVIREVLGKVAKEARQLAAHKALHPVPDWLKQALWRCNHHLVRGQSSSQRFTHQPTTLCLPPLLTPLGRSYDLLGVTQ